MGVFIIILPFFLFCFLSLPNFTASIENCPTTQCSKDEPIISYPFRIKGRQSKRCGHPGFDLTCDHMNRTVLELPLSGRFFVRYINYSLFSNEIQLGDPDDCLVRRIVNHLDLSGTPFFENEYQNYSFASFINCPSATFSWSGYFLEVSCLRNSTRKVFVTTSASYPSLWSNTNCRLITTVPVPVDYENVLHLTWNWKELWCKQNCNRKANYPSFGGPEVTSGGKTFLKVVGIIISITFATALCYSILRIKGFCYSSSDVLTNNSSQSVVVTSGLHGSALQSFHTVVLGESGRLPNPDISTCAICLSDYQPKETLKSLSGCNHCFHADCIDVWLHLNSTCPVCRVSSVP